MQSPEGLEDTPFTQNNFCILKSEILLHKLDHLSILKTF